MIINEFRGKYRFLSNFFPSVVVLGGEQYPSVEHAYQASKSDDIYYRIKVASAPEPSMAKKLGRQIKLRSDWEQVKVAVMLSLLRQKFNDPIMRSALRGTGDALLIEGNTWGDKFWGQVNGVGENMLGILLMVVRAEIIATMPVGNNTYKPDPEEEPF